MKNMTRKMSVPKAAHGLVMLAIFCWGLSAPAIGAEETLQVNAFTLKSKDGDLEHGVAEKSRMENFFNLQKRLVFDILDKWGISTEDIPPDVLAAIEKPHTRNFNAFMAYSQGLDYLDKEMFSEAYKAFQRAARLDPDFALAAEMRDRIPQENESLRQIIDRNIQASRKTVINQLSGSRWSGARSSGAGAVSQKLMDIYDDIFAMEELEETRSEETYAPEERVEILQEGEVKLRPDSGAVRDIQDQLEAIQQ